MGIIYCYTNKINGKKYVGQTINPKNRYSAHKSSYQNPKDKEYDSLLHRAFRKYGFENFTYEVLVQDIDDVEILNQLEKYYIKKLNCQIPNGYNVESGGKNCKKPKSIEHRKKEIWGQAKLTEEEVIELRLAYKNKKSPTEIYEKKYKDNNPFSTRKVKDQFIITEKENGYIKYDKIEFYVTTDGYEFSNKHSYSYKAYSWFVIYSDFKKV